MFAAAIGGPIAGIAYIIAFQLAGFLVIPITALTPATGALLGKIILKQELNKRKIFGVIVCVFAGLLIGMSSINGTAGNNVILGLIIAFIAAFGWGLEGIVAGYSTTFIDYEIGITVRQTISGIFNLFILLPVLSFFNGSMTATLQMAVQAVTDTSSVIFFIINGFFTLFAFSLWYKGNSICGAALGMACNASSFWGPFFCWIVIRVIMGEEGWLLSPEVWIGAVIMVIGIGFIALNSIDLFKKS